jgi:putative membrane protein
MWDATMPANLTPQRTPDANELAAVRTRLAYERTLMAWIRTAFAMITFGFTILKTFEYLKDSKALDINRPMIGPRNLGATLMVLGTVSLLAASWQHWRALREMKEQGQPSGTSLPLVVAIVLVSIGTLAFVSALWGGGVF